MSPSASNPVVQRLRLRQLLRDARTSTGLTQQRVAAALDCSATTILRIETGQAVPSVLFVRSLLGVYGRAEAIPEAVEMVRVAKRRSWTSPYHQVFTPDQIACMAIEPVTDAIHNVALHSVPPLLRTRAYARDVARALGHRDPDRYAEGTLLRQQQVFADPTGPPWLSVLIDEAVLWRCINGPVGAAQLDHIVWRAHTDRVIVRVVPLAAGMICLCSFTFLKVPDPAQTLLYVEDPNELELITKHDEATLTWHRDKLGWAHSHALPADDLPQIIDKLRSHRLLPARQVRHDADGNPAGSHQRSHR